MQKISKIAIPDTSCLILLNKIDELHLLEKMFHSILITNDVKVEFRKNLPSFIKIKEYKQNKLQLLLESEVDRGEASVFNLALETKNSILIIDDDKARRLASKLKLN